MTYTAYAQKVVVVKFYAYVYTCVCTTFMNGCYDETPQPVILCLNVYDRSVWRTRALIRIIVQHHEYVACIAGATYSGKYGTHSAAMHLGLLLRVLYFGGFYFVITALVYHFTPDIYISCVSFAHNVCTKGYYLAMVSTNVETSNPEEELRPGLSLLGPIEEK